MSNRIPITAEIVKLAQLRSRATGGDVRQEMARHIAQEAILELDPELDLLIDEDASYSKDDRLVSTFDVNDIVVNGTRIDVRLVGEDNRISAPRHLVGTSYMDGGTLAVAFHPDRSASIVGYIPRSDWDLQDKHAGPKEDKIIFRAGTTFDLNAELPNIVASSKESRTAKYNFHSSDIAQFCGARQDMKLAKQREFVEAALHNESSWTELQSGLSKAFVRRTLTHASVWNHKLETLAETLQPKFNRLSKEELKGAIAKMGEKLGGQPESSRFRKELLLQLTKEELAHSLSGEQLKKASNLVEQVFAGRSVVDVLKDTVKSKTTIDLAVAIKRQRQKITNFIEASSDEIAIAFRQLALQPVYATHSTNPEGVDAVNEALELLDACELAESLKTFEHELN